MARIALLSGMTAIEGAMLRRAAAERGSPTISGPLPATAVLDALAAGGCDAVILARGSSELPNEWRAALRASPGVVVVLLHDGMRSATRFHSSDGNTIDVSAIADIGLREILDLL